MKIGSSKLIEKDPFVLFDKWFKLASKQEISDPNAISLSTSDSKGFPNVRIVLMKSFNKDGLISFSNSKSKKGREIESNSKVAVFANGFYSDENIPILLAVECPDGYDLEDRNIGRQIKSLSPTSSPLS